MLHSIKNKVLVAMLSVAMFTACAMIITFYIKSAGMIENNYEETLYERVKQTVNVMDSSLKDVYYLNVKASEDESFLQLIQEYNRNQKKETLDEIAGYLRNYHEMSNEATSMYFIFKNHGIAVTSQEYPVVKQNLSKETLAVLDKIQEEEPVPVVLQDPVHEKDKQFSCVRGIRDEREQILGYFMTNMEERTLFYKYLQAMCDEKTVHGILLDRKGQIITSEVYGNIGRRIEKQPEYSQKEEIQVSSKGAFSGIQMQVTVLKSKILEDFREIRIFLILIFALFLCVAGILAFWVTAALYKPIARMTETVEQVGNGDLGLRVEVHTNDEIGILGNEFNTMLDHIEELIGKLLEEERKKKDAELESLQYQITPHFMYNTLNSIKYAALIKGEKEIGGLLDDFIELLQASINKKGTFITVADEVHILKNYIDLQAFRYKNQFEVEYQIEREIENCFVPRLILQPLVENALLHGIDLKSERGRIVIRGKIEENLLLLSIEDNGRGMSREKIKELLSAKTKKTHGLSAIGVANIKERLHLYYGEEGGIRYDSGSNGTTVTIFLPVQRTIEGGGNRVSYLDSRR